MQERGFVRTLLAEFCVWLLGKLAWEVVIISKEVYDAKEQIRHLVVQLEGHQDYDGSTKFRHADRQTKYLFPNLTDAERMWAIDLAAMEIKRFAQERHRQTDASQRAPKGYR